ncbi:hypothetical protein N2152v2_003385 [Parachlorella kessleri]
MWSIYRSYFSGTVAAVVPAHTRDAAFQLFCDLRANTPKDRKFLVKHMQAFVPQTSPGWLALGSTLAFGLTGLMGLFSVTLTLSVVGIYTGLAVAAFAGVLLSFVLGAVALSLFLTACCSGMFAAGALMGYASLSATLAVMRYLMHLVLGSPAGPAGQRQPVQLKEEAATPAATSRATLPAILLPSGDTMKHPTSPPLSPTATHTANAIALPLHPAATAPDAPAVAPLELPALALGRGSALGSGLGDSATGDSAHPHTDFALQRLKQDTQEDSVLSDASQPGQPLQQGPPEGAAQQEASGGERGVGELFPKAPGGVVEAARPAKDGGSNSADEAGAPTNTSRLEFHGLQGMTKPSTNGKEGYKNAMGPGSEGALDGDLQPTSPPPTNSTASTQEEGGPDGSGISASLSPAAPFMRQGQQAQGLRSSLLAAY